MLANTLQANMIENIRPHMLNMLPYFHIYGLQLLHLATYQASTQVILPRFEPETFLSALEKYKVSNDAQSPDHRSSSRITQTACVD